MGCYKNFDEQFYGERFGYHSIELLFFQIDTLIRERWTPEHTLKLELWPTEVDAVRQRMSEKHPAVSYFIC